MAVGIRNKDGVDFDNIFEPGNAGFVFRVEGNSQDLGSRYARVEDGESPGPQGVYGRNGAKSNRPVEDAGYVFAKLGTTKPKLNTVNIDYYQYLSDGSNAHYDGGVFRIQTNLLNTPDGTVTTYLVTILDNQATEDPFKNGALGAGLGRVCCIAAPYAVENVAEVTGKAGLAAEYNAAPNNFWKVTWKNNTVRRHCMTVSDAINKRKTVVQYISTTAYNYSNHSSANKNYPEFGLIVVVKDRSGNVVDGRYLSVATNNGPGTARDVFGGKYTSGHNWSGGFSAGDITSFGWVAANTSFIHGADSYVYHEINKLAWMGIEAPPPPCDCDDGCDGCDD